MSSIYEMNHSPEVTKVLDKMADKMKNCFGVTITGNRCTLRWHMNDQLVDVHMIIESVKTPEEVVEHSKRKVTLDELIKRRKKLNKLIEALSDDKTWS